MFVDYRVVSNTDDVWFQLILLCLVQIVFIVYISQYRSVSGTEDFVSKLSYCFIQTMLFPE